jgi:hypothetical protein
VRLRAARAPLRAGLALVVLGLPTLTSGCVLPIGPEFQDPPASQNFGPFFLATFPPAGQIVSAVPNPPTFSVTVQDPNVGDDLQLLWLGDFPPASANTKLLRLDEINHSTSGTLLAEERHLQPDCKDFAPGATVHQLTVIVTDGQFVTTPGMLGTVNTGAKTDTRTWVIEDCEVAP